MVPDVKLRNGVQHKCCLGCGHTAGHNITRCNQIDFDHVESMLFDDGDNFLPVNVEVPNSHCDICHDLPHDGVCPYADLFETGSPQAIG